MQKCESSITARGNYGMAPNIYSGRDKGRGG